MTSAIESEVTTWLETALAKEDLKSFSIELCGKTENGSGFVGDVIFVNVSGVDKQDAKKEYDLVIKSSKPSATKIKTTSLFEDAFKCEILMYRDVFPFFKQFQLEKGVKEPFDRIPKCYGVYESPTRYVLAMENLKATGYDMYDKKNPLTIKHIKLVIRAYAKFHAISVAVKEQKPEKFQEIRNSLGPDAIKNLFKDTLFASVIQKNIQETSELLKNDLSEDILGKWLDFKEKLTTFCYDMTPDVNDLQVLVHGDCWNNNFMYKYEDDEKRNVANAVVIDWQISKISTPVTDLSYFLFACIGPEDVKHLDTILKEYYQQFCDSLIEMGSTFWKTYSFEKLYQDWLKYAKFGLTMALMPIKISFVDKNVEIPDLAKSAEKGEDFTSSFDDTIENTDGYKHRLQPIVEYVVKKRIV